MRSWFAGLLGAVLALATAGCSTADDDEGPVVPWLAVYSKPLNAIGVRALDGRCGRTVEASEDDHAIRLHLVAIHQPGAGTCPSPVSLVRVELRAPVGNRTVTSADPRVPGVSIDVAGLLHFPVRTAEDLPSGIDYDSASDDSRLVLYYGATPAHPALKLTSTQAPPDLRPGSVTVRATRNTEPCDSAICWPEGSNLYRIDSLRGDAEPLSRSAAIAAAAQLTRG